MPRKKILILIFILVQTACGDNLQIEKDSIEIPNGYSLVYYDGKHSAFVDLIYYKESFYCAFRSGVCHVPSSKKDNGVIRIMVSKDGNNWREETIIIDPTYDLRDPSLLSFGEDLFLYFGKHSHKGNVNPKTAYCRFKNSDEGLKLIESGNLSVPNLSDYWLWSFKEKDLCVWSVGYKGEDGPILFRSDDGVRFSYISEIPVDANETCLGFLNEDIYVFSRPNPGASSCYARSHFPFDKWTVVDLNEVIQSPSTIVVDGQIFLSGRTAHNTNPDAYFNNAVTLFRYDEVNNQLHIVEELFTRNECGYPGMVYKDGKLSIAYYTCFENQKESPGTPGVLYTQIEIDR